MSATLTVRAARPVVIGSVRTGLCGVYSVGGYRRRYIHADPKSSQSASAAMPHGSTHNEPAAGQSSQSPPPPQQGGPNDGKFVSLEDADKTRPKTSKNLFNDETQERYQLSSGWKHPAYEWDQMVSVPVSHHTPVTMRDRIARRTLLTIRSAFDWATGYKHPPKGMEADPKYQMTTEKWLQRFVFLESIAGVPGMVGGMVRHLHSLRLLRRDRAWIETLLEEAYNERMHLLTFIKLTNPGIMMRLMLLGAQGVFFNSFFIAYLLSPRTCHRFVGYLEEEAVVTYTRCIEDMEAGRLEEWKTTPAPDIAKQYWNMAPDATVRDLIYYVRADECKHREVNHTFGNLKQDADRNPYALVVDATRPQPTKDLKYAKDHPNGWKRDEIAA